MTDIIGCRDGWVNNALHAVSVVYPSEAEAEEIRLVAESTFIFCSAALESPQITDSIENIEALCAKSRYLAVMLGSNLFDSGSRYALSAAPLSGSLFDVGLGWLPLASMFACDVDGSVHNAGFNGNLTAFIAAADCEIYVGSAAAQILLLKDLKILVLRRIEVTAQCSAEALADCVAKVSATEWEYAIADTGFSLLLMEGL